MGRLESGKSAIVDPDSDYHNGSKNSFREILLVSEKNADNSDGPNEDHYKVTPLMSFTTPERM